MTSDVFGVLCFHDLLILDRGIIIGTSNSLSTSHTPLICSFNVTLVGSWPRLTSSNYLLYSSVESIKIRFVEIGSEWASRYLFFSSVGH